LIQKQLKQTGPNLLTRFSCDRARKGVVLEACKRRSEHREVGALEDAKDVEAVFGRPPTWLRFTLGQLVELGDEQRNASSPAP